MLEKTRATDANTLIPEFRVLVQHNTEHIIVEHIIVENMQKGRRNSDLIEKLLHVSIWSFDGNGNIIGAIVVIFTLSL